MRGGHHGEGRPVSLGPVGSKEMHSSPKISPLKVAIVDDEPLARARMKRLLSDVAPERVSVVLECDTAESWLRNGPSHQLDLAFLDIEMPGGDGMSAVEAWPGRRPQIVFVSAHHEHALRAFDVGAIDYLTKPVLDGRLAEAITRAEAQCRSADQELVDLSQLSARQRDILALLASQKSNKEVARSLALSHFTVRNHMSALFRLFAVSRRRDLIEKVRALAPAAGIVESSPPAAARAVDVPGQRPPFAG